MSDNVKETIAKNLLYYRKKNKIQLLIRDHLQNMENTS